MLAALPGLRKVVTRSGVTNYFQMPGPKHHPSGFGEDDTLRFYRDVYKIQRSFSHVPLTGYKAEVERLFRSPGQLLPGARHRSFSLPGAL